MKIITNFKLGRSMLICSIAILMLYLCSCQKECIHEFRTEITAAAQCQKDGTRTYTCNLCEYSYTEAIAALEHQFDGGTITKDPTCEEEGSMNYTCDLCGENKDEPIAVIAHSYGEPIVTQAATCIEEGIATYTCTLCGIEKNESIGIVDHSYGEPVVTKAATCTEEGILSVSCAVCGESYQEPIVKIQHSFGETYVKLAATCAAEGELYADCTVCGLATFVEAIPKTDEHTFENSVLREPSCTDPGEGKNTCSICGYSEACSYELRNHEYNKGSVTVQPGCASAGKKEYACVNCGHKKEEKISATGHTWSEPNCTTPVTCVVCNAVNPESDGHEYELVGKREPGTHYVGYRKYQCKRCGTAKQEMYGKHGDYDFQAIADATYEYAKEYGFQVIDSTERTGNEARYSEMVFHVELCGGQKHLINKAKELVDYQYMEATRLGKAPTEFAVWVMVEYGGNASLGTGFFHVYVYMDYLINLK